jgi:hypothetical protein
MKTLVANPWLKLSRHLPFVLPEDALRLDVYHEVHNRSDTAYHLELPPVPFQGRPDAPIVLLGLNPGYVKADDNRHTTSYFQDTIFRNYHHDPTLEYPLFFLDPQIEAGTEKGGQYWWHQRLKPLRQQYEDKLLAQAFLSIQYVPYRSTSYKHTSKVLESQKYGFDLVRQAIERNALVIGLRSERLWKGAVPELNDYKKFYQLSNPRNPILSEQQFRHRPEGWQELKDEMDKLKQVPTHDYR